MYVTKSATMRHDLIYICSIINISRIETSSHLKIFHITKIYTYIYTSIHTYINKEYKYR